jgi:hypothetical protein
MKKKNVFMSFLEMDMIKICLFVEHQDVLESRKEVMMNEKKFDRGEVTLTFEDFFGRFGS